jgi:hypothetical protein
MKFTDCILSVAGFLTQFLGSNNHLEMILGQFRNFKIDMVEKVEERLLTYTYL